MAATIAFWSVSRIRVVKIETVVLTWLCLVHGDERVSLGVQTMGFLFSRCLVFLLRGRALLRLVGLFGVVRADAEAARLGTLVLIVVETARRLIFLVLVLILGGGEVLLTRRCSHGGGRGTARVLRAAGLGWALPCCWTRGVTRPARKSRGLSGTSGSSDRENQRRTMGGPSECLKN